MWLSFKIQLSAAPTGNAILTLKDLGKGKINPREVTNARKQSSVVVLGEQQRSEDQRFEREQFIRLRRCFFTLRTASAEAGSNRFCNTCSHGCRSHRESRVLCCVEELLPKHHDKAGRISLY